jgi:dihydrodipicolinate synthase/N-acetylneuraminate lyase
MDLKLLAASVTPLRDDGRRLDEEAIAPMVAFLEQHDADGVFCCGTTGEGVLLAEGERRQAAERFREAVAGTLIVHCGAQTTAETAALANHAASIGADGAAVIPPPYYPMDDDGLVEHFTAAAHACSPLPFYLYAFAGRSGYKLPLGVIQRVRERSDNVAGLKVSESEMDDLQPYLRLGMPVFVGSEPLIPRALAEGSVVGSVSGLAAAFTETVADVLHGRVDDGPARLTALRDALGAVSFIPALKVALALRGVPVRPDVRAPLRPIGAERRAAVEQLVAVATG